MNNCVIEFQPEAHDTAADHLRQLIGLTVEIEIAEDRRAEIDWQEVTATVVDVETGADGQYKVICALWEDNGMEPNEASPRLTLDAYDDIERMEVV